MTPPERGGTGLVPLATAGVRALLDPPGHYPAFARLVAEDAAATIADRFELAGARVLDLGSGHGSVAPALAEQGAATVSLDLRPKGGHRVVQGDALRLPFRTGAFDGVVSVNLLEHVPSASGALGETARVLRSGGWAYVCWTTWYSPLGGHEYSPWHYLGPNVARRMDRWARGRPVPNIPGERLFPVHVGPTLRLLERPDSPFVVRSAVPRYWPRQAWIVRVPGFREVFAWNCLLLLERR
ncbi:MAG TPA: class I SAM-dependent methyltransferase [Actinomycetota bacterium]|nr:class I SAM-dependent methyltransferase [Actinomycetota bacterium]